MSIRPAGIRTVEVRPPSALAEAGVVARAALCVVLGAGVWIGFERGARATTPRGAAAARELAPDEVAFADLPSADQRVFRALQEGVLEAERLRGASGAWPSVAELAAAEIPPFAPDPLDRAGYTWTRLQKGLLVNYAGVPARAADRPAFLVLILEPVPGAPVDPRALPDEIHHVLADGAMLHVSIWSGASLAELREPLAAAPVEQGWRRIALARSTSPTRR